MAAQVLLSPLVSRRDDLRGTTIYFDNEKLSWNQAFSLRGGGGRVRCRADASVCLHEMLSSQEEDIHMR